MGGTGSRIGMREGHRIVGDKILTQDDVVNRTSSLRYDDGVVVATAQIDFHILIKAGDSGWRQQVEPYNIPFGCIVARDFSNLLMAGKCIRVDQVIHSSCRMTPTCCAMGQSAGTVAAFDLKTGVTEIHQIDIPGYNRDCLEMGWNSIQESTRYLHHTTPGWM